MNSSEFPDLPPGWGQAPLDSIVIPRKGKKPHNLFENEVNGSLPYIDIEAFEHGTIKRYAMIGDGIECSAQDVLLVWDGARCGLAGRGRRGLAGSTIMVLTPKIIDTNFLFRFLQLKYDDLNSNARGTGIPHLDPNFVWSLQIPMAPLAEQRRIVAKIEALLAESKTALRALEKVPPLLQRFRQSALAKAFKGELTQRDPNDEPAHKLMKRIKQERSKGRQMCILEKNEGLPSTILPKLPETWIWTTIGELETFVGSGITPRGGKKVYADEGIPFIRSQNVHPDGLHLENVAHITSLMHEKMKRTQVQSNDVLLNITGASIGRSTYVPEGFGEANVNQHVCIIRTGWWIIPAYLSHFLNSLYGQDQIFATESGVTREGLNYTQVRSLRIPLAPLAEQRRIVDKIERAFSLAAQVEGAVKKAKERADRIDQAILARAFRGELVPQDPNDEPASVLLQRVKAEITKLKTKVKKKKRKILRPYPTQTTLTKQIRSIRDILKEMGEATVEQVLEASGLSASDFWEELKKEIDAGQIEEIRKGYSIFLKVKG